MQRYHEGFAGLGTYGPIGEFRMGHSLDVIAPPEMPFLSPPVPMHDGHICIAFRPSVLH